MDPSGWNLFETVITGCSSDAILELRDVFLVPRIWFSRSQKSFYVAIISILDTALQLHRNIDMASQRRHSFTAPDKNRHGFRDKWTPDLNRNGWGRSHLPPPRQGGNMFDRPEGVQHQ